MTKILATTALVLALAAPASATGLFRGDANANASATSQNINNNNNSNRASASQGQHQGQAQHQGQSQGQSLNNRNTQANQQRVRIEDRNQAPGFGVPAATGTAPCIKPQGLSLSVPLGGAGFHVSPTDRHCLNIQTHYMIVEIMNMPNGPAKTMAIRSLASIDAHAFRMFRDAGLIRAAE